MIVYDKEYLFNRTVVIDIVIQDKIKKAINSFIKELESEEINIISKGNKEKIKSIVQQYENKIAKMFKNGFTELENDVKDEVNSKKEYKEVKQKEMDIDGEEMVAALLQKVIDNAIEELENEQIRDKQFLSQCIDRRMFIKELFEYNLLNDEKIMQIINYKDEKLENEIEAQR